ncbi:MAG: quinolinate synthase NadA [Clostridiales bacterium]|nr:quinolinate synthase NadA [Clostridiales bacterium]
MKSDLVKKIELLKKEKNAVILAHYYCSDEIQEIADYIGDSFYLAKIAKEIKEDKIVFCGVSFMGESAKIINPQKTVLMPDITADCPMAHMVKDGEIERLRKEYDDLAVVCYVNSVLKLKTQSDVCVTSSNAVKIVKALPNKNIFFIPDQNLGRYVKEQVPEKNVILNDGFCPRHKVMTAEQVKAQKALYPNALVLAHPECTKEVLNLADYIGSTAGIISFAKNSDNKEFIICTEVGVLYQLQKDNPDKKFVFVNPMPICEDMKKNTLEKIIEVLISGKNEIIIDEQDRIKALKPLDRMLELAK